VLDGKTAAPSRQRGKAAPTILHAALAHILPITRIFH